MHVAQVPKSHVLGMCLTPRDPLERAALLTLPCSFPTAEISGCGNLNVLSTLATERSHTLTHFQTRKRRIKERDYFFMGLGLCSLSSNLTQNRPLHSTFGKICGAGVPETLLIFHLADLLLWFRVCLGLIQSLQGKNRECLLWAFKSEQCARSQTLVAGTDVLACK